MTNRERMKAVLNGNVTDRLPVVEWATWWNLTVDRWNEERRRAKTGWTGYIQITFGLDPLRQIWIAPRGKECPKPAHHGAGIMETEEDYEKILPHLFSEESLESAMEIAKQWAEGHERGDFATWLTLEGFFWFPRTLFGIEGHLYSFYDEPELLHRINRELTDFHIRCLEKILPVFQPEFMTFAGICLIIIVSCFPKLCLMSLCCLITVRLFRC